MTRELTKTGNFIPGLVNDLIEGDLFPMSTMFDWDNNFFSNRLMRLNRPSVNIMENDKEFKIELAAPGLEKKDFKVETDNNTLTISVEKESEEKQEKKNYTRKEYSYTAFMRSFKLPENCVPDKINAEYNNGILTLSLPKKEMTAAKLKKEIKVS